MHLLTNHFALDTATPKILLIQSVCSKPSQCNQPADNFSNVILVPLQEHFAHLPPCRQFQFRVGAGNFCSVHVSLVPVLGVVGEQKTKPTQHSVAVLRSLGINPHLLACRSSEPLEQAVKVKLVSPCHAWDNVLLDKSSERSVLVTQHDRRCCQQQSSSNRRQSILI